jgi:hypothetical protein
VQFTIELSSGHLKAEMTGRDTAAQTAEFVAAIIAKLRASGVARLLVSVRKSRPVFKVEDWGLSEALEQLVSIRDLRVALVSDTRELGMSQDYIAFLARQRGLDFQTFRSEDAAVAWLERA